MRAFAECWNEGKFFEAHEALEPLWIRVRKTSTEQAKPLQGLIQLSVALHHLRRGNLVGARKMVERALERFEASTGQRTASNLERARRYALDMRSRLGCQGAEELIAQRPRFDG